MKKFIQGLLSLLLVFVLVACGNGNDTKSTDSNELKGAIHVVSREDGSGTRGAFVEIVKVQDKDGNDLTVQTATFSDGTGKVIETVSTDKSAIGYASLGSVEGNKSVKTVKVNGVTPNAETILSKEYPIQRPLNIAFKDGSLSALGEDFVSFMLSKEGQEVAVKSGFVQVDPNAKPYEKKEVSGELNISGSTSVGPLVKKLAEAYKEIHSGVNIIINETGSSAGMKDAIAGVSEIGMASRELKDEEKAQLKDQAIAMDGIAMIVAADNKLENLTIEQVKSIYIGEVVNWEDLK